MKILYAVQATGNGHIARAMEIMPFLQQYGSVDVMLSGSNSTLQLDLPVKFRSKGLSLFYGNRGGLNYLKMAQSFAPARIIKEALQLPVADYDIVISDFESITALACKLKRKPFLNVGHQASFVSPHTPRPQKKDAIGEWILQHYASSAHNIGLHFRQYDDYIYSPILKSSILNAQPVDEGHITVYLSHYSDAVVMEQLRMVKDVHFHVFSKQATHISREGNITLFPVNNALFNESMIHSTGVITGAGFETPAEALYMGKKLLCLPILGQYEQWCNAAALEAFGVRIIHKIDHRFAFEIKMWLNGLQPAPLVLQHSTDAIIQTVIEKGCAIRETAIELPGHVNHFPVSPALP